MHRSRLAPVLLLVVSALACAAPSDAQLPVEQTPPTMAHARCAYLQHCGIGFNKPAEGDTESCEAILARRAPSSTFDTWDALVAAERAGKVEFDGAKLAACAKAIEAAGCDTNPERLLKSLPACQDAFQGKVAQGGGCIAGAECQPGLACTPPYAPRDWCSATCQPIAAGHCRTDRDCADGQACNEQKLCAAAAAPGGANEPCGTDKTCQVGLICLDEGTSHRCVPLPGDGEPCAEIGFCKQDLFCVGAPLDPRPPRCTRLKKKGEACTFPSECFDGFYCAPGSNTCVEAPAAGSGPCAVVGAETFCNGNCQPMGPESTPTCLPFTALHAACQWNTDCDYVHGVGCVKVDGQGFRCEVVTPEQCVP